MLNLLVASFNLGSFIRTAHSRTNYQNGWLRCRIETSVPIEFDSVKKTDKSGADCFFASNSGAAGSANRYTFGCKKRAKTKLNRNKCFIYIHFVDFFILWVSYFFLSFLFLTKMSIKNIFYCIKCFVNKMLNNVRKFKKLMVCLY